MKDMKTIAIIRGLYHKIYREMETYLRDTQNAKRILSNSNTRTRVGEAAIFSNRKLQFLNNCFIFRLKIWICCF